MLYVDIYVDTTRFYTIKYEKSYFDLNQVRRGSHNRFSFRMILNNLRHDFPRPHTDCEDLPCIFLSLQSLISQGPCQSYCWHISGSALLAKGQDLMLADKAG